MKSLLFVFFLFDVIFSHAQSTKVIRLRSFEVNIRSDNDNSKVTEDSWTKRDFLVVIDLDKDKIHTYSEKELDIDLVKITDTDDNDTVSCTTYTGVDQNGERCQVYLYIYTPYTPSHVATLVIHYLVSKRRVAIRLKKDN
jgi:hypothetical protein